MGSSISNLGIGDSVKKVVDGITYVISKSIDKAGETAVTIYKQTAQGLVLVYTDTERNLLRTLNNTQTLLANAYIDTEQNVLWGIRAPIEKTLHIIDNHLDQAEQILMNSIYQAFDMGELIVWAVLVGLLLFLIFLGKDTLMQIIDLVKNFKISLK